MHHALAFRSTPRPGRCACLAAALALAALPAVPALAQEARPSPAGAQAYFLTSQDGETVSNPVLVRFGLKGMGVAPAGVDVPDTGHHHLIIDSPQPKAGEPIPTDEHHIHFGGGQTETSLTLAPGQHTLQMVLGDHAHIPHNPPVLSRPITITVK